MDHAFFAWLRESVPPGQYNQLTVTLNTLRDLYGPELDDLGINIVARVGFDDRFSSIDRLMSDCLNYAAAGARLFGITLSPDWLTREQLPVITTLLRGLLTIDKYEFNHALKGIIEGDFSKEEQVAELVAEVMGEDPNDFLSLLQDVPDVLIEKIHMEINRRFEADLAVLEASEDFEPNDCSPEERAMVFAVLPKDDPESVIVKYVTEGGRLGLTVEQYMQFFGHYVANQKSPKAIAESFYVIGAMAKIPKDEIVTQMGQHFDAIIGDIHRIMQTRKALIALTA